MTFEQACESFIDHCRYEKKLSSKTIEFYSVDLSQFEAFLITKDFTQSILQISKEELRQYLKNISVFKPKTIKRKVATLKAFFNFLEFEDKIEINPFRKLRIKIKDPRILPALMNSFEVKRVFEAAYKTKNEASIDGQFWIKIRDIAVIEMLFATGMRVSELCSLKNDQINLETGFIRIYGKGGKERTIQIYNKEAINALREYTGCLDIKALSGSHFFLNRLGKGLSDQSVRHIVRRFTQLAEISKNITPHTFRHTFATLLLEEDVDIKYIQHFLGHSSIATTQIYTHVTGTKQKQILTVKHPRNAFEFR